MSDLAEAPAEDVDSAAWASPGPPRTELREFLRLNHQTTLPRFDVMAALYRRRDGRDDERACPGCCWFQTAMRPLWSTGWRQMAWFAARQSEVDRRTVHVALTPEGTAKLSRR
jgi:hypothetical protein